MRAHYLQHVPFESLGSIGHWLQSKDYATSSIELLNSQVLPAHESESAVSTALHVFED